MLFNTWNAVGRYFCREWSLSHDEAWAVARDDDQQGYMMVIEDCPPADARQSFEAGWITINTTIAILRYYGNNLNAVRAFYTVADAKLHGSCPLVDAILDEIDRWLTEQEYAELPLPTEDEVSSWPTEL